MKDYKIGYIINIKNKSENNKIHYDWMIYCYRTFINYIKIINDKYDLQLNIIEIEDYTKEECDLVIYEQFIFIYEILCDKSAFKNAKGNPKFLMYFLGEPHTHPYWFDGSNLIKKDVIILRTLLNYIPYCNKYKCYGINSYEDTLHNCYIPYCIDTRQVFPLLYNTTNILKNKNIEKIKFCSMIVFHGTKEREIIYNELSKYKKVDCFGNFHKNVKNKYYEDNELNIILPNYKFNICFENTQSDYNEGYITEKICNAFKCGSVPIYWGNNKQIYEIFNKNSFINLTDVPKNKWVDLIKEYDTNDELYNKMLNEPPIIDKDIYNKFMEKKEKFIIKILSENY